MLPWYAIGANKQEQPAGNYLTPQFHDSVSCRNLAMESPSMMTELLPGYKHSQPPPPPRGSGITEEERPKTAPSSGPGNSNCRTVSRFTAVCDPERSTE